MATSAGGRYRYFNALSLNLVFRGYLGIKKGTDGCPWSDECGQVLSSVMCKAYMA
ncbi:hypothetical protein THOG10_140028 [Vibrio rotiferianus]|nr:hypothetical protein THOG10_140028 [Vibrio rotiferianus]